MGALLGKQMPGGKENGEILTKTGYNASFSGYKLQKKLIAIPIPVNWLAFYLN